MCGLEEWTPLQSSQVWDSSSGEEENFNPAQVRSQGVRVVNDDVRDVPTHAQETKLLLLLIAIFKLAASHAPLVSATTSDESFVAHVQRGVHEHDLQITE